MIEHNLDRTDACIQPANIRLIKIEPSSLRRIDEEKGKKRILTRLNHGNNSWRLQEESEMTVKETRDEDSFVANEMKIRVL